MSSKPEANATLLSSSVVTRRAWIGSTVASALVLVGVTRRGVWAANVAPTGILVYASPDCQCCRAWIKHLESNGFAPAAQFVNDVAPIKRKRGVPEKLWS